MRTFQRLLFAALVVVLVAPVASAIPEPARALFGAATDGCYPTMLAEAERREGQLGRAAAGSPPYPIPSRLDPAGLDPRPTAEAAAADTLVTLGKSDEAMLETACFAGSADPAHPPDLLTPLASILDPLIPREPDCDLGLC